MLLPRCEQRCKRIPFLVADQMQLGAEPSKDGLERLRWSFGSGAP